MGSKYHIPALKQFLKDRFPDATKNDLFACFIERGYTLAFNSSHIGIPWIHDRRSSGCSYRPVTEGLRQRLIDKENVTICTMAHLANSSDSGFAGREHRSHMYFRTLYKGWIRISGRKGCYISADLTFRGSDKPIT